MKCNNCGTELTEGAKFCPVCGQPVTEQPAQAAEPNVQQPIQPEMTQQSNVQQAAGQNVQQGMTQQPETKKKKTAGFKVGIAAIIVVVLAVGAFAAAKVIPMLQKANMSPSEYYQYVETKTRDEGTDILTGYYDTVRQSVAQESYSKRMNLKLNASDTAKALLALTGVDISGVKDVELDITSQKEKTAFSNLLKVRANDNDLVTVKAYVDADNKEMYLQVPELSEAYLDASKSFDELSEDSDVEENSLLTALYDFENILPETKDVKTIYNRYTDLVIQSAVNVTKEEGGCEAEGVSQDADKYTITMNGGEIRKLAKDILNTLKDDNEIKGIVQKIDSSVYDSYVQGVEDAIADVETGADDDALSLTTEAQISSDDTIIGRTITIKNDSDEIGIRLLMPRDGEKFGCEMAVTVNGVEYVNFHGTGTEKKGVINGEFTLSLDESLNEDTSTITSLDKALVVAVKDYDCSGLAEGKVSGTVTYSTEAVAALANYSLQITSEGDAENATGKISVLAGQDEFVTLDMTVESDVETEEVKPSDSDTVYDVTSEEDMQAYQSQMDVTQLLQDLQNKLGIDLSSLMGLAG